MVVPRLGYDSAEQPILFVPELEGSKMALPDRGVKVDANCMDKMVPLGSPL